MNYGYSNNFSFREIYSLVVISCTIQAVLNSRIKRVINGLPVNLGDYPRAVTLKNSTNNAHLCGGTILNTKWVLTAAHCIDLRRIQDYRIDMDNSILIENEKPKSVTIGEVYINEEYNKYNGSHDIALIRLFEELSDEIGEFSEDILPTSSFGLSGTCQVYGYGATEKNADIFYNPLRVANVEIISLYECRQRLGKFVAPMDDWGMICALGNNTDACNGDSGSPLICDNRVEGIVSYGIDCGLPNLPGVYTRVVEHLKWIYSIIKSSD